jgi:hypothetical protein
MGQKKTIFFIRKAKDLIVHGFVRSLEYNTTSSCLYVKPTALYTCTSKSKASQTPKHKPLLFLSYFCLQEEQEGLCALYTARLKVSLHLIREENYKDHTGLIVNWTIVFRTIYHTKKFIKNQKKKKKKNVLETFFWSLINY